MFQKDHFHLIVVYRLGLKGYELLDEHCKSGKIYVVARFKPSGNVIMTPPGERETFNKNVLVRKY